MRIALFGLPLSGKTTIYKALAGFQAGIQAKSPNRAVVSVSDHRLDKLYEIYKVGRKVPITVEYLDMPSGFGASERQRHKFSDNFWAELRLADALVHVVRVFDAANVAHVYGKVDYIRDLEEIANEVILADFSVVENSLNHLARRLKSDRSGETLHRHQVLLKCQKILEDEKPLRSGSWTPEEEKILRNYQFLSLKPLIAILNVGETQESAPCLEKAAQLFPGWPQTLITSISGQMEMEIAELPPKEQAPFLKDMNLTEPAQVRFPREVLIFLGRISFFTTGKKEVRAWEIGSGTTVHEAAGVIHSDMKQGFIRAEVFKYDELISAGGVPARLKETGKIRLEGKDYIVEDGDVITIRFNI